MSGCHEPESKCSDGSCIACNGGVWSGIYPPTCNGKIKLHISTENWKSVQQKSDVQMLLERIEELEKFHSDWKEMPKWDLKEFVDLVNQHQESIKEIERRLNSHTETLNQNKLAPFKCPVCEGRGKKMCLMPQNTGYWEANCVPCNSKGVIWG